VRRELGGGVLLRTMEEADAAELLAVVDRSRTQLAPWMPWVEAYRTHADAVRSIRESREQSAAGRMLRLAIVERERIVGVVGLHEIDRVNGVCRCGYWLAPEARGRGLATRALASLLDHVFGDLGLHRVELRARTDNVRSRQVARRLGFRFEGVLREVERNADGHRDHALYAMLAREWTGRT
jgi:ribosomal-protein-serine acetyltransferase